VPPEGPSFYLKGFYYDIALSASPHALLSVVDSSRIMFGSDYAFATGEGVPPTVLGITDYHAFGAADLTAIARENAARLFPPLRKRT